MPKVLAALLSFGDVSQSGVYDAFREAGCELEVFDYFYIYDSCRKNAAEVRRKLIERCGVFQPDLVHLQIQHTDIIDAKTVAAIKRQNPRTVITNWTGDVRNYVPETYKSVSKYADFNLISSTGQKDFFQKEIGREVKYWQIGYNPKLYYQSINKPVNFEYDVSFIANTNYLENYPGTSERERVCKLLRERFGSRFGLFGNGWPESFGSKGSIAQPNVAQIYHKSFCVLSVSHYNNLAHYFSDRLLMCLASGRPTISLVFPHWQSYFTHNSDIVIAESVEDIPNKVQYLLNNPHHADFIGESGAALALAEHTYLSRVIELLEMTGVK